MSFILFQSPEGRLDGNKFFSFKSAKVGHLGKVIGIGLPVVKFWVKNTSTSCILGSSLDIFAALVFFGHQFDPSSGLGPEWDPTPIGGIHP